MVSSIDCSKAVVLLFYSLFVVAPIVCGDLLLDTCFVLQKRFVLSSFAIISLGKRELGTLVCSEFRVTCVFLSSWSYHGLVCRMWLWQFLVILTYLLVFLLHHRPNMFVS